MGPILDVRWLGDMQEIRGRLRRLPELKHQPLLVCIKKIQFRDKVWKRENRDQVQVVHVSLALVLCTHAS